MRTSFVYAQTNFLKKTTEYALRTVEDGPGFSGKRKDLYVTQVEKEELGCSLKSTGWRQDTSKRKQYPIGCRVQKELMGNRGKIFLFLCSVVCTVFWVSIQKCL